ncbi:hypothetical protein MP638_002491 [Amoeboaphelidium occidentale]|nr:hypothetical protein MP638_002491 [Amoeboaphelidium occidentale]
MGSKRQNEDEEERALKKLRKKEKEEKKEKKEKKAKKEKSEVVTEADHTSDSATVTESAAPEQETIADNPGDFSKFPLSASTVSNLKASGISSLFPIQIAAFQPIFDGLDVIGRARTGTGKTLGFALPIVERLHKSPSKNSRSPRVLVMCPTRELAKQVSLEFQRVNKTLRVLCVYGGVPYYEQEQALRNGLDVVVGTPGRIIDHLERGRLILDNLDFVVLDEADQMLDIGFADSMESVLKNAKKQTQVSGKVLQVLLFSATLPTWISEVTRKYLRPDKQHTIDLVKNEKIKTNDLISHKAIECNYHQRRGTLGDILKVYAGDLKTMGCRTIVFADTKNEANELALGSDSLQGIECQVLHGDIAQKQREITLQGFRDGKFGVLIATDVAARGLDIPNVELVIQLNPPKDVDTFVHRSGRTGRAGKSGTNIVFYKPAEEYMIRNIMKKTGMQFEIIGAPQVQEILQASAKKMAHSIKDLDQKQLDVLMPLVKKMIEEEEEKSHEDDKVSPAEKLLAKCLSLLSGNKLPQPRSLVSCNPGYIAVLFKFNQPIRTSAYVRSMLKNMFPDISPEEYKGMRLLKDSTGACCDIPVDHFDRVIKTFNEQGSNATVEVLKSLPDLMPRDSMQQGGSGGYGGYGSYGGGNNNNYSNNRYRGNNGGGYGNNKSYGNSSYKRNGSGGGGGGGGFRKKY